MIKGTRMILLKKSVMVQEILKGLQQQMRRSEASAEELRDLSIHDK